MLGLVLEGGGARGAYEIGAVRALMENGYKFDGVVGTSIGAINAAVIAQGDWELASEIWARLTPELLFPGDESIIDVITKGNISKDNFPEAVRDICDLVKNGGLDTKHIRELLEEYIDEEKIRSSPVEFGLVTYSVSDKKSVRVFKGDIPKGKLVDYLIASSMLPVFKQEKLDGKFFIDGGYVDVCPYNMLIERGFDELVIVRVFGTGVTRKMKNKDTAVKMIIPSDKLSSILDFSSETVENSMNMGYFDALRIIKGYKGRKYYIEPESECKYFSRILSIGDKKRRAIGKVLGLSELPGMRMMFDGIIPILASCLELPKNYSYGELLVSVLESVALSKEIDRFKVYTFDELLCAVNAAIYPQPDNKYTRITMPYRTSSGQPDSFKLPSHASRTAYAYKMPSSSAIGTAVELLLRELSEKCEENL